MCFVDHTLRKWYSEPSIEDFVHQKKKGRNNNYFCVFSEIVVFFFFPVRHIIKAAIEKFPNANGLVVAFANTSCPLVKESLPNIYKSSETICATFSSLGYAFCKFNDCTKAKFLAIYSELAFANYPPSYKMLFTHFSGHGRNDFIGVKDGVLLKNSLKNSFTKTDKTFVRRCPKVIFFDCCRNGPCSSQYEKYKPSVENLMVIHTTTLGHKAYFVDRVGVGIATGALVNLLKQEKSCSFGDMIAELNGAVKNKYKSGNLKLGDSNLKGTSSLWLESYSTLDTFPNLYEDKLAGSKLYISIIS